MKEKTSVGIIIGNRDFFPDKLVTRARADILQVFETLNLKPTAGNAFFVLTEQKNSASPGQEMPANYLAAPPSMVKQIPLTNEASSEAR
jgi:hypothetical protein